MDKENSSFKNYKKYLKGKEPLENVILQHPEENSKSSIYEFMKKNVNRRFWIKSFNDFKNK